MIANPGSKQPSNLIQRIRINSIFVRILPINCGRVCGMVCEFVKLLNNMHSLKEFCQPSDGSRSVVWTGMLATFEWERERARERWCREQRWDEVMRFFFALAYSCYRIVDLIFVLFLCLPFAIIFLVCLESCVELHSIPLQTQLSYCFELYARTTTPTWLYSQHSTVCNTFDRIRTNKFFFSIIPNIFRNKQKLLLWITTVEIVSRNSREKLKRL